MVLRSNVVFFSKKIHGYVINAVGDEICREHIYGIVEVPHKNTDCENNGECKEHYA